MIRISYNFNKRNSKFIIIKSVTKYKTTKRSFSKGLMARYNDSFYVIKLTLKIFTDILIYMLMSLSLLVKWQKVIFYLKNIYIVTYFNAVY